MSKRPKSDPASLLARMVCFTDLAPNDQRKRIILTPRKNSVVAGFHNIPNGSLVTLSHKWWADFATQILWVEVRLTIVDVVGVHTVTTRKWCPFSQKASRTVERGSLLFPTWTTGRVTCS